MPLDQYTEKPAALMEVVPGDDCKPTIWDKYRRLLDDHGENSENIEMMERFAFYDRAKKPTPSWPPAKPPSMPISC